MFSVGLKLEQCVIQVSLTMANQDSFFQRIKASEKSTGLPDQTALTRQCTHNLIVLKNQKHMEGFPLKGKNFEKKTTVILCKLIESEDKDFPMPFPSL